MLALSLNFLILQVEAKELKFVKHIIFRIIMNDKIKEFEKDFDDE